GPLTGRLGGLYLILVLAIVDVGYGQTVMFKSLPPTWGAFLPARGAGRLLLGGAFSTGSAQIGYLLLALGWLAALTAAAALVFRARIGARPILATSETHPIVTGPPDTPDSWSCSSRDDDAEAHPTAGVLTTSGTGSSTPTDLRQ
ncbi:MAG: hypothetical protein ACYCVO_16120, partial [Acidimicrobiales bacterium]